MAWTPPPIFATTSGITPGTLNTYVRDNLKSIRNNNDAIVQVYLAANFGLAASGFTPINWTAHDVWAGTTAIHATSSGQRLYATETGRWRLCGSVMYNAASGYSEIGYRVNATASGTLNILAAQFYGAAIPRTLSFSDTIALASGEFVSLSVYANAGASAHVIVGGGATGSRVAWEFVGAST